MADLNLAKVKADPELGICDEATAKFVEITEEFTNTHALLTANLTNAGKNVLNVFRGIADHFSVANTWFGLWVVFK